MAISPQNPFYVLQFAETSVTNGETGMGLKMYLRCLEMMEDDEGVHKVKDAKVAPKGIERRAWIGVKLVSFLSVEICLLWDHRG